MALSTSNSAGDADDRLSSEHPAILAESGVVREAYSVRLTPAGDGFKKEIYCAVRSGCRSDNASLLAVDTADLYPPTMRSILLLSIFISWAAGCSQALETGYVPRKLNANDQERREGG